MEEKINEIIDTLIELLEQKKFSQLKALINEMMPADLALLFEELDNKDAVIVFRLLSKELSAETFAYLDTDRQQMLIQAISDKELHEVLDQLFLDDTVDIIDEMPANVVKRILKNSDPENRKQINELLEYPDDSAGSIMTTEYVSFSAKMTVDEAFDKIRRTGPDKETIYTCYVTDGKKRLIGVVTVKKLLLSDKSDLVENIMDTNVITASTLEDKEQVAMKFSKYDFLALPVVDKEGCLVGIVTVDDAVDVLQEEATEDIQKMAAMLPTEKPYLKQSVWSIWKARIPWLLLLMVSATFTSMILSGYENRLSALVSGATLYAFVPMLMDTAGNAGSQSSVTIVRALALGEVEFKDVLKVIWKELRAAFFLSLTVSAVCFTKILLIDRLYNSGITVEVAAIVSCVLMVTIILAKFVGCTLPLLAKKCKLDPAVVASPFITTIVDALSLVIYCSVSIAILP